MSLALLFIAAQAMLTSAPVPDAVLAEERGGFRLPSGVDVALSVETQTAVNGAVVLKTVFKVDQGTPTLTTYVPKTGVTVQLGTAAEGKAAGGAAAPPAITFDGRGGVSVIPGVNMVGVSAGKASATGESALADGLQAVSGTVATDNGTVAEATRGAVRTVTLTGNDLSITHLAGNAFGSAVANAGSDRTIDTTTTVGIDLGGAGPDVVGSAMLRVEDVAIGAMMMRTP